METAKTTGRGRAFRAGIWYVISNIVVKAIAIITTPIFTRMMTTSEYGVVQNFISWNSILLPIFTLNLTYSIGRAKLDFQDDLDNYTGSMQLTSGIFSAVVCIIAGILIHPVSRLLELTELETTILLAYLFFETTIQFAQNRFRYRYQYKQNISIAWYLALSTTLLSLALIWIFHDPKPVLRMIGLAAPCVVLSLYFWITSLARKQVKFNKRYISYGLRISLPLIVHNVSMHILSQSDRIFITKIWGTSDTAFYSLAYTYGVLLHVFTNAVAEGWLPWFHDTYFEGKFDEIRKNVKPLVILGCYISLAGIALAPEAVFILGGNEYTRSIYCVPPVILGVLCQYVYTHYVNIEMHLKKTSFVSYGTIFAAALNIALNAIFIPRFGFIAAAYTTLASYLALMVVHFIITRAVLHVKLYKDLFMFGSLLVTFVISGGLMYTYQLNNLIRYGITFVGLITCIIYFRSYIGNWITKFKSRFIKKG